MKKGIVICLVTLIIFPFTISKSYSDPFEKCKEVEKMSEAIMKYRQNGLAMSEMINILEEELGLKSEEFKLYREIVIMAYEEPKYTNKDRQKKIIREFSNKQYLYCVKTLREN